MTDRYRVKWPHSNPPHWLAPDDTVIMHVNASQGVPVFFSKTTSFVWENCTAFTIDPDHWAVKPLREGFEPWSGDEKPPKDWDSDQPYVLLRTGMHYDAESGLRWEWKHNDGDIIGYKKRAGDTAAPQQPLNYETWEKTLTKIKNEMPADWAIRRAHELLGDECTPSLATNRAAIKFAHYIEQHEEPPVDPDVLAVREICAAIATPTAAEQWRDGTNDHLITLAVRETYRRHASGEALAEPPTT